VTILVHVNVVPGDQAAGQIPDTKVRTELIYQQVQEAKRRPLTPCARATASPPRAPMTPHASSSTS